MPLLTLLPVLRSARRSRALALSTLLVAPQVGCTREFFREWANQDVSEAVFEKSRDPRWRIDLFSAEPPKLARFASPYDPDNPAAPPDDYAAQAMAPVPQWPQNRLLVPAEGTGYLDMLEAGPKYTWQPRVVTPRGAAEITPAIPVPPIPAPAAPGPSPFAPAGNSGPRTDGMSPTPIPASVSATPPSSPTVATQVNVPKWDLGVKLAAFQETGMPLPVPPAMGTPPMGPRRGDLLPTPPIGMDPDPSNRDLSIPVNPRPDLTPDQHRAAEALGSELSGILVAGAVDFNEAEAAGLPRSSHPYNLTIEQAFRVGLTNARIYQYRLEQIYLAALAVTLQRFAFQPQFYAGLSPLTGVAEKGAGVPVQSISNGAGASVGGSIAGGTFAGANPLNQFLYRTIATGSPASGLNIGTVAGMGKVFNAGGQLLMGFANQVVFNFIGKNSKQPAVQSSLPLTFVQPFLRGGGRAVTLEPLTQAERELLYEIRNFAKFRQEFVIVTLLGGTVGNFGSSITNLGFSVGGNIDPTVGFIQVLQNVQEIENDRKNLASFEQLYKVYTELIQGESSGLSRLQLDQVDSARQNARLQLVADKTTYRSTLDQFKIQIGLPPDVPLVPDRTLINKFKEVFDAVDEWQMNPRREMTDLPALANELPHLEDVVLDGRSCLKIYDIHEWQDREDSLEDLLLAAERTALEHRLDLMNNRAALYDNWRQIRVAANALKGVFNITLTNQYVTPPTTTNPFAFVDQAKQFSLVLNAELPLVRVAERNNFRSTLINYERQRRALQNQEDFIKYQVRQDIRSLQTNYLTYELYRRNFVLTIRQKDQGFENIIAPPAAAAGAAQASQAAIQTTNLINFQNSLLNLENNLVQTWLNYQTQRLTLYRDLGTLPYDEWEAYRELFPSDTPGAFGNAAANRNDAGVTRTAATAAPESAHR